MTYAPVLSVISVRSKDVNTFRATTCAPGITAPLLSRTTPKIVPVVVWAVDMVASSNNQMNTAKILESILFTTPPCLCEPMVRSIEMQRIHL